MTTTANGRRISRTAARPATKTSPRWAAISATRTTRRCAQINKPRLRRLGAAWVNNIEGGITTGTNQSTPVVVDGTIYIESAFGNVVAVDGKTGATKLEVHADPRQPDAARRGGGAGPRSTRWQATTTWSRSTRTPARWSGSSQHDGFGNVEKVAVVYYDGKLLRRHQRRRPRRGARARCDQRRSAVALLGRAGPGEFGNDTWEGDSWHGRRRHAVDTSGDRSGPEASVFCTFGNARARLVAERLGARRRQPVRQLDRRARTSRPARTSGTSSRSTTTSGTWTT